MSKIKVIAFDLDDTIVDYTGANRRATSQFVAENESFFGVSALEFERVWALERRTQTAGVLNGSKAIVQLRIDHMKAVCKQLCIICEPFEVECWIEKYFRIVDEELVAFSDVPAALDELTAYRCIIATNGAHTIQSRKLDRTGLSSKFERLVCSVEEGVAKPDPNFYRRVINAIGVRAQECLMVGDSCKHDVLPPRTIGMHSILIDRISRSTVGNNSTIQSLCELSHLINCFEEMNNA